MYLDVIEVADSSGDLDEYFAEIIQDLTASGAPFSVDALDCDQGAFEGLGMEPGDYDAIAMYFESIEGAEECSTALELDQVSIVEVTTSCVD